MFSEAVAGKKPSQIASAANARGYRTKTPDGWAVDRAPGSLDAAQSGAGRDAEGRPQRPDGNSLRHHQWRIVQCCRKKVARTAHRKARSVWTDVAVEGQARIWVLRSAVIASQHSQGKQGLPVLSCRATAGGRPACGYQISAGGIENAVADRLPNGSRDDLVRRRIGEVVEHVVFDPESREIQIRW